MVNDSSYIAPSGVVAWTRTSVTLPIGPVLKLANFSPLPSTITFPSMVKRFTDRSMSVEKLLSEIVTSAYSPGFEGFTSTIRACVGSPNCAREIIGVRVNSANRTTIKTVCMPHFVAGFCSILFIIVSIFSPHQIYSSDNPY